MSVDIRRLRREHGRWYLESLTKIDDILTELWLLHQYEPMDNVTLGSMSIMLKDIAPGNYTLEWDDLAAIDDVEYFRGLRWKTKTVFADKHEELVWWLKWR